MAKSEERNLNVTIKNESDDKDSVVISLAGICKMLKKYFLPWIIIAVIIGVGVLGFTAIKVRKNKTPLTALVSFNYDGIEKGLDPAGQTFDINIIKNPQVITNALIENNMDIEKVSNIRDNLRFSGIMPEDAIDRITVYKSIYENANSGNLPAAQAMLDVDYYPTLYTVSFNYAAAGISSSDAVLVLNSILNNFRTYFFNRYGYNQALGSAVAAINYVDYDYSEAVDLFKTTLDTLAKYVDDLSKNDSTYFRSSQSGHTFNDIYQSINSVKTIDLDRISSYVTVNNVTKNRESTIAYYQYRIDSLTRNRDSLTEKLNNLKETIDSYKKDSILVVAGVESGNTELTQASEEYDTLIERRDSIAAELAETKQNIKFYTQRKEGLENDVASTPEMSKYVDEQLALLNQKLEKLIEDTRITSEEYFETVEFANAYNILVPSSNPNKASIKAVLHNSMIPVIIAEAIVFIVYLAVAFIMAIKNENSKKLAVESVSDDYDKIEEDDDTSEELSDKSDTDSNTKKPFVKKNK